MVEQPMNTDHSESKLDFSFLKELPEDQLTDINGAAHLINHFWDHRHIPGLDLSEMATVLQCNENQIAIAQKIIGELERVGSCPFKKLPQELVNEEITTVSSIWSKKFEEMKDRENPNWREKAKRNLRKLMREIPV